MKKAEKSELFRELPSVDETLRLPGMESLAAIHGVAPVTKAARAVLARLREEVASELLDKATLQLALDGLHNAIEELLRRALGPSLRPVINATGVILHTNLGRAPLAESALAHIRATAGSFSNLEFDLESGCRGKRDIHVDRLFGSLLGETATPLGTSAGLRHGEKDETTVSTSSNVSTIVVNNNAAAVLLALNTLAEGGEVVVSRGELVEIGGSFRIPDVMAKSGASLREVGTTNRTRTADYENAITERTRLLLRVHRSNFEITGFTEQASTADLVTLARQHELPLMEDLGSGALVDLGNFGISGESSVLDSLRVGVDIVTYSGDKLLGGPQAGLISGRADLVARMRGNSLFRALRVDKLTYAALEATLLAYVKRDHDAIPTLRMMRLTREAIGRRAEALAAQIASSKLIAEVVEGESVIGGGAAPSSVLPTRVLALACAGLSADELAARLRAADPPIIARVEQGRVLLDLRTVFAQQDEMIEATLVSLGKG
ncbi:MAG TPA: L-seryl-tRNA(Sec) selenium transferase [Candidatus Sulfotelmatobacter sp.]|jgi:L-seryl-tRNA(Ser) seleniumtransferase